jgi:hypothetical protein
MDGFDEDAVGEAVVSYALYHWGVRTAVLLRRQYF